MSVQLEPNETSQQGSVSHEQADGFRVLFQLFSSATSSTMHRMATRFSPAMALSARCISILASHIVLSVVALPMLKKSGCVPGNSGRWQQALCHRIEN
jgi:hypothetical protein